MNWRDAATDFVSFAYVNGQLLPVPIVTKGSWNQFEHVQRRKMNVTYW